MRMALSEYGVAFRQGTHSYLLAKAVRRGGP